MSVNPVSVTNIFCLIGKPGAGRNTILKNVLNRSDFIEKYNIRNVPVLVFTDDSGNELKRIVGFVNKQKVIDTYNELQ